MLILFRSQHQPRIQPPLPHNTNSTVLTRAVRWLGLGGLLLAACKGAEGLLLPSEGEPASIEVIRGDGQSGRVSEPLAERVVVEVTDPVDRPVAGATVAFELTSGGPGADIIPRTATTDANGRASAQVLLGTTIGQHTGEASVVMDAGTVTPRASFTATAVPVNANSMAAVGGVDQIGSVDAPLPERLVVQVTDVYGNPISGKAISWEAQGGGTVSEPVVNTDDQGQASVERVLGPVAGQQTTVARSEGLAGSPVTFVHTAVAGNASLLTIVSGDNQTGQVGTPLPAELVVRLLDGDGNGVPNTAVTWVVATGGGSVTPTNSNTDQDGRASARWTLGTTPGAGRLDAVVSGVGVVSFDAIATTGAPATLAILTQPSSSARNGIRLERQPVIQLRDAGGNPVTQAGVLVSAALGAGSGDLTGTRQRVTDASGRASFTDLAISGPAGRYTLVFSSSGYASATSTPIDLQAISTSTTILSDTPDPSAPGAAFTVEFRVTSAGPVPTGSVTVSDGSESCVGNLRNGAGSCSLALNNTGQRTLTATYSGGPGLLGSSDTEPHRVEAAAPPPPGSTVTTITADTPDPSLNGSTITVRFRVTASGTTPTGSVTVTVSGESTSCTGTLVGGEGSCQLSLGTLGDKTLTATYSGAAGLLGSSDTEPHTVAAQPPSNQPPVADYTWNCTGLTCQFSDRSTDPDGSVSSWSWNFGDGNTSPERNPSHTFPSSGSYTVTLTVTDDDGATDDLSATVEVQAPAANQPPVAAFTTDCRELDCRFNQQDSHDPDGRIVSWLWSFGDGASSDDRNPRHEYASGGTYNVTLTVTDDDGATDSETHQVTANATPPPNQAPTAAFTANCGELTCSFDSGGSSDPDGNIVSRSWNFGDGTGSNEVSPSHTYASAGAYTVTVTVTDDDGATDSETHQVTVAAPPPPNQAPTAAFTANCGELTCSFNSAGSSDPDGNIASRSWNFGDGTGSNEVSPSHTYASAGTYTVTLTVTDDDGAADTETAQVTVTAPPPPNQSPSAAFTSSCADLTCSFDSGGSSDPDGTIVSRSWNFGDGTGSDEVSPSHAYAAAGTYTVTLTVTDDDGSTDTETAQVTATAPPPPNAAPVARIGSITCVGTDCTFTDDSTDPDGTETISQWSWVFGDGATSTERNPVHAYTAPAEYNVHLTVTDDGGLTGNDTRTVTVPEEGGGSGEG